jgi:hypothetical protein
MFKKALFISALCLAAASSLHAYTITQNFSVDPWSNGWTKVESASAPAVVFNYNTTNMASVPGYLDCAVQRSTATLGQAYIPLNTTYFMPNGQSGSATVTDMWLGFDLSFGTGTYSTQQMAIGIFNSSQTYSNSATQNTLGLDLAKATSALRVRSETINSTGGFVGTSTATTMATIGDTVSRRFQVHYYISGGKVYADVKVGVFDDLTGAFTANVFTQNGVLLYDSAVSWDTIGMNAMGIKNLYMTTGTSKTIKFNFDNMYFSTDSEQNMAVPSWVVPEPATMVLLGLGSLLLSRRRHA